MTTSPGTRIRSLADAAEHQARLLPSARYRHPGDVIRLHAILRADVETLDRERKEFGPDYQDHGMLFCWENGQRGGGMTGCRAQIRA